MVQQENTGTSDIPAEKNSLLSRKEPNSPSTGDSKEVRLEPRPSNIGGDDKAIRHADNGLRKASSEPLTYTLNGVDILVITKAQETYSEAIFLEPMHDLSKAVHSKLAGKKCIGCASVAFAKAAKILGTAFSELCYNEYSKNKDGLMPLKKAIKKSINKEFDVLVLPIIINGKKTGINF